MLAHVSNAIVVLVGILATSGHKCEAAEGRITVGTASEHCHNEDDAAGSDDIAMLQLNSGLASGHKASTAPANRDDVDKLSMMPIQTSMSSLDVVQTTNESIPNTIFLAGPWYPGTVININKKFVPPNTEFRYFDYEEVNRSAKHISEKLEYVGVHGAYAALMKLRAMAYRMDLWRYMILWEYGGVYLDAKITLQNNISNWFDRHTARLVLCMDVHLGWYSTSQMAARRKEPILLQIIQRILDNINSHDYEMSTRNDNPGLCITGPCAITRVLEEHGFHPQGSCSSWKIVDDNEIDKNITKSDNSSILMVANKSLHENMRDCRICNSYQELISAHAVYCDEALPEGVFDPCVNSSASLLQEAQQESLQPHNIFGAKSDSGSALHIVIVVALALLLMVILFWAFRKIIIMVATPAARAEFDGRYFQQMATVMLYGILYLLCSTILIAHNKYLMNKERFPFAIALVLIQQMLGSVCTGLLYLVKPSLFPSLTDPAQKVSVDSSLILKGALPIAVLFSAQLVLSNTAYMHSSVAFLQMMKESNLVLIYFFSLLAALEKFSWTSLSILAFIIVATTFTIHGEANFSMTGFMIQGSSQLFECGRIVLQAMLLTKAGRKLDALTYVMLVVPLCAIMLGFGFGVLVMFPQEHFMTPQLHHLEQWWPQLLLNACIAFALNVSIALFIKHSSAVAFILSGIVKDAMIVAAGGIFLKEVVSLTQIFGFCLQLIGVFTWGMVKHLSGKFEDNLFGGEGEVRDPRLKSKYRSAEHESGAEA